MTTTKIRVSPSGEEVSLELSEKEAFSVALGAPIAFSTGTATVVMTVLSSAKKKRRVVEFNVPSFSADTATATVQFYIDRNVPSTGTSFTRLKACQAGVGQRSSVIRLVDSFAIAYDDCQYRLLANTSYGNGEIQDVDGTNGIDTSPNCTIDAL
jgi:hypothetical protein